MISPLSYYFSSLSYNFLITNGNQVECFFLLSISKLWFILYHLFMEEGLLSYLGALTFEDPIGLYHNYYFRLNRRLWMKQKIMVSLRQIKCKLLEIIPRNLHYHNNKIKQISYCHNHKAIVALCHKDLICLC